MNINDLNRIVKTPLSPLEIQKLGVRHLNQKPRIVIYDDIIRQTSSIEHIFDGYDGVIIYYPNKKTGLNSTYGHYCALTKDMKNKTIYFFDSYGEKPDQQKPLMNRNELYQGEGEENTLVKYLLKQKLYGWNIDYNNKPIQSYANNSATCGRWSLLRTVFSFLTNDEFVNEMFRISKIMALSPDQLVALLLH